MERFVWRMCVVGLMAALVVCGTACKKKDDAAKTGNGAAVDAGKDYAIKLDRPLKAGDRFKVSSSGEITTAMKMTSGSNTLKEQTETMKATLEGEYKVVAVNEKGHPTSGTFTVSKWDGSIDGQPVTEVQSGMIIEFIVDGKNVSIRSKDEEFAGKVKKLLEGVLPDAEEEHGATNDDIFGTKDRKKVGEKWPVNVAAAVKDLADMVKIDEKDMAGTVQLEKVVNVDGVPCLHVTGSIGISKVGGLLPPEAKVTSSKATMSLSGDLPVDVSLTAPITETASLDCSIEADVQSPRGPVHMAMMMKATKTKSMTAIK